MKHFWVFFSLLPLSMASQTFTWSTESEQFATETEFEIEHVIDQNKLFKIKSKYNDKVFNKDVFVDIFDLKNDFEKEDTNILSVDQPVMGLNMLTLEEMFYLSERNYIHFLSEYNRDTREYELFFQKANIDTKSKSKLQLVTKMIGKNGTNPGNFKIAQSQNKQFYAVLKEPSYDKKINEKITICLLDANLKVVKEVDYEFTFSTKQSRDKTLYVSNFGSVYLVKNIDLPKIKPYLAVYFWDGSSTSIKETSLKLENDLQINQFKGQFVAEDFYLQGFYSENIRFFQVSMGESSPANGIISAQFSASGNLNYITLNPTNRYKNFYLKDAIHENNKTWMLFDQTYKNTKRLPSADPSKPFEYRYEYLFESKGITLAMIDNTTGKMEWLNNIDNPEPTTINDNGAFLSCLYFLKNNQLSLIYNDTRDLNKGAIHIAYNSRMPVLQTFDSTGKMTKNIDLSNAGVGGTKSHCYELDTSLKVKVNENTFIVRSRCGTNAIYGYLNF